MRDFPHVRIPWRSRAENNKQKDRILQINNHNMESFYFDFVIYQDASKQAILQYRIFATSTNVVSALPMEKVYVVVCLGRIEFDVFVTRIRAGVLDSLQR